MSFLNRLYNTITCSRAWYFFWELKYKIAFGYIYWLLKRNGIESPTGTDVLWHYILGKLTDKASLKGIGVKHLYLFKNRFFKIRGFSLVCIMGDDESIKNFCNIDAREAYHILSGLIQLPIINASHWSKESQEEKHALMKLLEKNSYKLWRQAKQSCKELSHSWKPDNHLPFNVGMQAFSILGAIFFSLKSLPDEIFPLIERFERIWGAPKNFRAAELNQNVEDFLKISEALHEQRKETSIGAQDILVNLYNNHKKRKLNLTSPESINIAGYFPFFENIPKAMLGLFTFVFSNKKWCDILNEERERLKHLLKEKNISDTSKEGFDYILNHSEIFFRFYMETLRCWPVAPVLPRINSNLLFNKVFNWGGEMRISKEFVLPTRSIAIVPQFSLSSSKKWTSPKKFKPFREEYRLATNQYNQQYSVGQRPLVQGAITSYRSCPAKKFTRTYFYAMLWWFPKYNQIKLSQEERDHLEKPLAPDTFYRPLSTSETQQVYGELKTVQEGKWACP